LIAKGDIKALKDLLNAGGLSAAGRANVQAAIKRLESTAQNIISKECKGSVLREFPSELLKTTLAELKRLVASGNAPARKALKLLTDKRFRKETGK
jgi:hypothetical protein